MPDASTSSVRSVAELGMIMIKGDLADRQFRDAIGETFGPDVPRKREAVQDGDRMVAWMAPDELLATVAHADIGDVVSELIKCLDGVHALVLDVSDLRVVFELEAEIARDVLAKGTPADVSPENFPRGKFIRSRIGQIQAAFWWDGDRAARIVCRRSESEYLRVWLEKAASDESRPGFFDQKPPH